MNEKHKDYRRVCHMLDCINKIDILLEEVTLKTFNNDFTIHIAAERLLEIIGEAAARISSDFREKFPKVPWDGMRALRNIISHEYFDVDYNALWDVLKHDIPDLKTKLMDIKATEKFSC